MTGIQTGEHYRGKLFSPLPRSEEDDRREQLGQGETSDCLSTRRRWQKSSTKVKVK